MKIVLGSIPEHSEDRLKYVEPADLDEGFDSAEILYEKKEMRGENSCHLVKNDGTTKAVFTAFASFYADGEGGYRRIDNTLVDRGDSLETRDKCVLRQIPKKSCRRQDL